MLHALLLSALFLSPAQAQDFENIFSSLYAPSSRAPAAKKKKRAINWAQPPVACVEELLPNLPERKCPDLSQVSDPLKDMPDLPDDQLQYWQKKKRELLYCRAKEVLRREKASPGSMSPTAIELSWMQVGAVAHRAEKLAAIQEASRTYEMPAQVLVGALYQESLFSELGIAEDGKNYSCGLGQINVVEWCQWLEKQPPEQREKLHFADSAVNCGVMDTLLMKPYYDIAKTRLKGLPEYRLSKEHFQNINLADVVSQFPPASDAIQNQRHQIIRSFVDNCQDPKNGILAKGNALARLYQKHIPLGMKLREQYAPKEKFNRKCEAKVYDRTYPLHSGWLLAVGSYNAGPVAVSALAHYNRWNAEDLLSERTFEGFTPAEMIPNLYWSGRYNPETDRMDMLNPAGKPTSMVWFKECVLQRHIARVVQHVTLPGVPNFVDSQEGEYKCAKSIVDENGKLIESKVPPFRQNSPGQKQLPIPPGSRHHQ